MQPAPNSVKPQLLQHGRGTSWWLHRMQKHDSGIDGRREVYQGQQVPASPLSNLTYPTFSQPTHFSLKERRACLLAFQCQLQLFNPTATPCLPHSLLPCPPSRCPSPSTPSSQACSPSPTCPTYTASASSASTPAQTAQPSNTWPRPTRPASSRGPWTPTTTASDWMPGHWEGIENEAHTHHIIAERDPGLAPRFLAYVTENRSRVVGFLLEHVPHAREAGPGEAARVGDSAAAA